MAEVDCRIGKSSARLRAGELTLEADLARGTFEVQRAGKRIVPYTASAVTFAGGERFRTDEMPQHVPEVAASGGVLQIEHRSDDTGPVLIQRFSVEASSGGLLVELIVRTGRTPLTIDRLHHLVIDCRKDEPSAFEPRRGLWMWRFGAVSPGDPVLFLPLDSPDIPKTHDRYRWLVEDEDRLGFTSEMLAVFRSFGSGRTCLVGFVTVCDQAAGFAVTRQRGVFDRVLVESRCDLEGLTARPGEEINAETMLILPEDDAWKAVEKYADILAERQKPRLPEQPLVGWSDWQYYRREVSEDDVIENIEALAAEAYPIDYVLVDDGYQRNMSDWLSPNERFPHGIRWLAERIRENGFKPGIWIAPLTAHESSELVREHPDWLLTDSDGKILTHDTHMGKVHTMDYTVHEALDWLRTLVRTLVHEYGYRWVKLDGPIRHYYDRGVFRNGPMTSVQHIRIVLRAIREAADDAIVEGEGYYGPSIALVDTQRVTQDIQQDWPRLKHTAQVNLLSTFLHRRWWINNPDAFILRDEPSPACNFDGKPEYLVTGDELRTEVTALALSGGVVMLTDNMTRLTDARKSYVDAFIPVYETPARPVDLFNGKPCPEVFHQKVRTEFETYDVIAVFNWDDQPCSASVDLRRIDLEKAERYVAFEYWTQMFLGTVDGSLDLPEIPAHGVKLLALRPLLERPFVMGTSLHVTQGGIELTNVKWDDEERRLCLHLRSWKKGPAWVHIHLPDAFQVESAECTTTLLSSELKSPGCLAIHYEAGGTVGFEVSFKRDA